MSSWTERAKLPGARRNIPSFARSQKGLNRRSQAIICLDGWLAQGGIAGGGVVEAGSRRDAPKLVQKGVSKMVEMSRRGGTKVRQVAHLAVHFGRLLVLWIDGVGDVKDDGAKATADPSLRSG